MCIIAIKPKGKEMFSDETLKIMFNNNPDGAGYMYYDKKSKKVVIKKGFMSLKALKKSLKSQDFRKTNLILHFRIGTSGNNDKYNCHPYPVYQKNDLEIKTNLGVAHNGILSNYIPPKTSKINDTQVFIKQVLFNLKNDFIYDNDKINLISELIGSNKLAFLDDNNNIKTIGNFIEDDGYIYSNDSYKPRAKVKTIYTHYSPSYSSYMDDCWDTPYEDDYYTDDDEEYFKDIFRKGHSEFVKEFGEKYWDNSDFWDWADEQDLFNKMRR